MGIINKLSKSKNKIEEKSEEKSATFKNKTEKIIKKPVRKNTKVYKVLLKPVVSEKATSLAMQNKYVFIVNNKTNKLEVKKAIKELYNVNPISISMINVEGKAKRFGVTRGRRSDYKKAIITLEKGKTIHIHEGV
jgi:large subunit ribosomal protein L23